MVITSEHIGLDRFGQTSKEANVTNCYLCASLPEVSFVQKILPMHHWHDLLHLWEVFLVWSFRTIDFEFIIGCEQIVSEGQLNNMHQYARVCSFKVLDMDFGCKWSSQQIVIDIMLFMKCRWNVDRWPHLYLPSMMDDRSSTLVAKDLKRLDLDLQRKTACVELDTCGFVWGHEETSTCVYGWFEEGEVPAALQGVAELVVLVVLDGDLFPLLLLLLWLTFSTSNPDWGVPNRNSQLGSALTQRKTTWIHATADSRRRNRTIFLKAKHLTEAALWLLNEYPDRRFFNTFAVTWQSDTPHASPSLMIYPSGWIKTLFASWGTSVIHRCPCFLLEGSAIHGHWCAGPLCKLWQDWSTSCLEPSCNPVVDGKDGTRKRPGYEWYMVAVVEMSSFAILLVHACVRCAPNAKLPTIVVQHSVLTSEKSWKKLVSGCQRTWNAGRNQQFRLP